MCDTAFIYSKEINFIYKNTWYSHQMPKTLQKKRITKKYPLSHSVFNSEHQNNFCSATQWWIWIEKGRGLQHTHTHTHTFSWIFFTESDILCHILEICYPPFFMCSWLKRYHLKWVAPPSPSYLFKNFIDSPLLLIFKKKKSIPGQNNTWLSFHEILLRGDESLLWLPFLVWKNLLLHVEKIWGIEMMPSRCIFWIMTRTLPGK